MAQTGYIKGIGIWYPSELRTIRKKEDSPLQPIFEAFTNSLEAIRILKEQTKTTKKGNISIKFHLSKNLLSKVENTFNFNRIVITDTGIGLNDVEYKRLINLRDDRKNFMNKGTGRIQFLHTFDKTYIKSIYVDDNSSTGFTERIVTLSKSEQFLINNTIIRLDSEKEIEASYSETTITFETVLDSKDENLYRTITAKQIKSELIGYYLAGFCENRKDLPQIKIATIIDDKLENEIEIASQDIPVPQKEKSIEIYYSKVNTDVIEKTSKKESFNLKAFLISKNELNKNGLKLISKGEVAKNIKLDNLLPTDQINDKRYLFLLTGSYLDKRDCDTIGEISLVTEKELKKRDENSIFSDEEILIEDIEDKTNQTIVLLFREIEKKRKEKERNIQELQEMFLLNDKTLESLKNKIKIEDSDNEILQKVYEADVKIIAKKDAEIKMNIDKLNNLDPISDLYDNELNKITTEVVKYIPLQNRNELTRYIARREIILKLFDKILRRELNTQKTNKRNRDEKLLHNLIFQQSASNPEESDLWLINEDFIYFKGASEGRLCDISIEDKKLFKNEISEKEEEYLLSLGENRKINKPDVLLFPDEGKCIIIEFKNIDVNVSDYLNQINKYASLIRNYSIDENQIDTFYGYLIGEKLSAEDIRDHDSDFKNSYHFDFVFRPNKTIVGKNGRPDGSLYTEVIKYSTLLERAHRRNKIFIEKLKKTNGKIEAIIK